MSETRLLMDTYCTITIVTDSQEGNALLDEAFTLCEELEALLSITLDGSDIWRVNHAGGQPMTVDARTIEVIERGIEFGELSDGMFDITIGRLSRLWDFGGEPRVPAATERDNAQATVNYRQIILSKDAADLDIGGTVQLQSPDAWLDLGGIAKGYIADRIAEFLTENGIENALIDLGGDIVALGNRNDGTSWRLGVRKPFGSMDEFIGVIEVTDAAVVSSGVYERQFEQDGVLYHHIIDPKTGMPARSDVISATIIADDAVTGEGLSTIAILAGSERIREICEQTPGFIGAVIILDDFEEITFGDLRLLPQ